MWIEGEAGPTVSRQGVEDAGDLRIGFGFALAFALAFALRGFFVSTGEGGLSSSSSKRATLNSGQDWARVS